jgi:hypothetical protein
MNVRGVPSKRLRGGRHETIIVLQKVERTTMVRTLVALGMLAGASCSPEAKAPDGVFFPTTRDMNSYPSALIEGTLQERDGCVFIESQENLLLVLWPEGFRVERDGAQLRIVGGIGHPEPRTGQPLELGGGSADLPFAQELIGEPIPSRCRAAGYWIASP